MAAVMLLAITAVDLWYWNSDRNPLAYARASYDETYGAGERVFARAVARSMPPMSRFDAPERIPTFGPLLTTHCWPRGDHLRL